MYKSLRDAGIPKYEHELREGPGPDPQVFYVNAVHPDPKVANINEEGVLTRGGARRPLGPHGELAGHFVMDADGTFQLELATREQAISTMFALNNPKRMALFMQLCGH